MPGTADKAYIDLLKDKCIYIAGGHYHYHHSYPSGEPFFFVPGSGEYWDHTEFEQTKGYIIFDTESKTHQFFKSELRNVINLNIIHKEDSPTITVLIEQVLSDYAISNEDIINLKIQLSGNALYERNDIEDLLENYNPLKYYIKVENKDYISSSDFTDTALSTDAIEQEILSGWDYFSNDSVKAQYVLDKLKKYQEDNREDDFVELFDSLLDELIEGGINADS